MDWSEQWIVIGQLHKSLQNQLNDEKYKEATVTLKLMENEIEVLMKHIVDKAK